MLLDAKSLNVTCLEPDLGSVFGDLPGQEGAIILFEALRRGRSKVAVRDLLFVLLKAPNSKLNAMLVNPVGLKTEDVIDALESNLQSDAEKGSVAPIRFTSSAATPEVNEVFSKAADNANGKKITMAGFGLAVLENAGPDLESALHALFGKHRVEAAANSLKVQGRERWLRDKLFIEQSADDASGQAAKLGPPNHDAFSLSGRRLLRALQEDVASMGASRITVRHLLCSLVADESSPMALALAFDGHDVKKGIHAFLTRELIKKGATRTEKVELNGDTLMDAVRRVLVAAADDAESDGASVVSILNISRAFADRHPAELTRLSQTAGGVSVENVRSYLRSEDYEEAADQPLQRLSTVEIQQRLRERIIGQDLAIEKAMPWIKRLRFAMPREGRPAAVFVFLGPTGTGKTQLAKELARYVYGSEDNLIFLEMGQFQSEHSMSTFVGAPPGYVGYGDGLLTNGLRDHPESVVLFDEIEKANTRVFDALLRFCDEGLIMDPAGPVRDGRKCIVVMTSNCGQKWLQDHLKSRKDATEDEDLEERMFDEAKKDLLARGFRPEFLGRVDCRMTFLPLTGESCRAIIDQLVEKDIETLRRHKGIALEVDPEARAVLAFKMEERVLEEGARSGPRIINDMIWAEIIDLMADREDSGGSFFASGMGRDRIKVVRRKA